MKLIYCDKLAHILRAALKDYNEDAFIADVSTVKYNLGAFGELKDTTKYIFMTDAFGTRYQITVEEV